MEKKTYICLRSRDRCFLFVSWAQRTTELLNKPCLSLFRTSQRRVLLSFVFVFAQLGDWYRLWCSCSRHSRTRLNVMLLQLKVVLSTQLTVVLFRQPIVALKNKAECHVVSVQLAAALRVSKTLLWCCKRDE